MVWLDWSDLLWSVRVNVQLLTLRSNVTPFDYILMLLAFSWERDCGRVPWPHPKACRQLHRITGVLGLPCCWRWNRLWPRLSSARKAFCWLWEEVKARVHCLSLPSNFDFGCRALQQCLVHSLASWTHWCCGTSWQWGHLWHLSPFTRHREANIH